MQGTKQICDFALHKFLEKIEEAILEGFRVHKTPTSYAKLIGGRYNVVMVKPVELGGDVVKQLEVDPVEVGVVGNVAPTKPTARKTTKKTGDESES